MTTLEWWNEVGAYTTWVCPWSRKDSAYDRQYLGVILDPFLNMQWVWACQYIAQVYLAF